MIKSKFKGTFDEMEYFNPDTNQLLHYGTPRHSGRYPWGSGKNPQRSKDFITRNNELKEKGLSETERARILCGPNGTTSQLRAKISIATAANRKADMYTCIRLKEKGMSITAISQRTGFPYSTVVSLLDPSKAARNEVLNVTSKALAEEVSKKKYIDVGEGVEARMNISRTKLDSAIALLKEQGYETINVQTPQLGTKNKTTVKVLAPKGTTYQEVKDELAKGNIKLVEEVYIDNDQNGNVIKRNIKPPVNISSDRVCIAYAEDGGINKDGLIELRRNVDDLNMGNARYAQVRIAVDGTHYLKGMATYSDDIPEGFDIRFNTNKSKVNHDKISVMKEQSKDNPDEPFNALISRQNYYIDKNGKEKQGALNIVREEGEWLEWSDTLSAQMLSKQRPSLARQQLDLDFKRKQEEFDEIKSISNPVLKQQLLEKFADGADASAVHLKAAAMPRQAYHVLLPLDDLKDNEVFAPRYADGEKVVLIRYPHGGIFEIPELTVNNRRSKFAKNNLLNAQDAIGISHKAAEQLSGADFDGDTALVIPNNDGRIKVSGSLKALKDFDPKEAYPAYPGMLKVKEDKGFVKGREMGKITNLITDMNIKGASEDELARAVKHSMVIIDAEKHNLNYKQSKIDNNIADLVRTYQWNESTSRAGGPSTLISKAKSEIRGIPKRKVAGYDPKTGEVIYKPDPKATYSYYDEVSGQWKTGTRTETSTKMAEAKDARTLSSGTAMEEIYAEYANNCKSLANKARLEYLSTKPIKADANASKVYANEIKSLKNKLIVAKKNQPLERQAQILGKSRVNALVEDNPGLSNEEIRKLDGKTLAWARRQVGAKKQRIEFTDKEWEAIQANAVSPSMQKELFKNANPDKLRERAIPRSETKLSTSQKALIKSYERSGFTQKEIADALGLSTTLVSNVLRS